MHGYLLLLKCGGICRDREICATKSPAGLNVYLWLVAVVVCFSKVCLLLAITLFIDPGKTVHAAAETSKSLVMLPHKSDQATRGWLGPPLKLMNQPFMGSDIQQRFR